MLTQRVEVCLSNFIFATVFFFNGMSLVQGQEIANNQVGDECSILRVALAYAESIHSYDALVLERQSYEKLKTAESPTEGTFSNVILTRTVFDQSPKRVQVSARAKSEWLELDKIDQKNQGRTIKVSEWGFLIDDEKQKIFSKQGSKLIEIPGLEHLASFEDLRTAGFGATTFGSLEITKSYVDRLATGESLIDSREAEDILELRMNLAREEEAKVNHVHHYHFDKKTHLPVKCQTYVEFDAGGRTQPEEFFMEWKEISNIYVPVKLRAKACRRYQGPNGEVFDGILTTEFHLHWLMINEPLPKDRFKKSILTDSQKFIESIDPVKNNATSIIEVLEKEEAKSGEKEKDEAKHRDKE